MALSESTSGPPAVLPFSYAARARIEALAHELACLTADEGRCSQVQPETADERLVAGALRALTLDVTRIQAERAPACDYWAHDGQANYLLEVKSRLDPNELWTTVERGEVYESRGDLGPCNRIERRVDYAMKQLSETRRSKMADFALVALVVRPVVSRDAEFRRVFATLYGAQELLDLGADFKNPTDFTCLYFRESRFFRHRGLNGAIVFVGSKKWTLCVNDHASNIEGFRQSRLYREFEVTKSLFDPLHATRERRYLIADFDMPRSDPGAVQNAVRRKYGLDKVVLSNPSEFSAVFAIQRE